MTDWYCMLVMHSVLQCLFIFLDSCRCCLFCTVGIKACMEETNPVEEEPYEINVDNQGCHGGPKAGRLKALANVNILSFVLYVHVKAWVVFLALSKIIILNNLLHQSI